MPQDRASSPCVATPAAADAAATAGPRRISVLLPLPLKGPYDYAVPDGLDVAPGDYVAAPLGGNIQVGVAWGEASGEVAAQRL